jgi:phenylalanyl-tRNA synthetase beta chain
MKISLNWLNDYIQTGLSAEKIADILSNLGLPYESIEHLDGDAVIDVEVTSNRSDCLSYIGIARELAAATGKPLKVPQVQLNESDKEAAKFTCVEIAEPKLCRRYTARIIEAVRVGPSPDWLKQKLLAAGMRSVNNVVDATNYAMLETGQPPHAFDYAKIAGGKIIVRKAAAGEQIISIDGTKCQMDKNMLIIADAKRPVAIAGVMGGLDTEVSDTTTTILLEDAYFDPVSVRTTSRKLALPSEASYRFERIVDVEMVDWASKRTAQLITQLAGGKIAKGVVDIYPGKPAKKEVTLRLNRLKKLLGIEVPVQDVMKILTSLCFAPAKKDDAVVCEVPSWRSDVYREADLIEEVARVYGYDKIPAQRKIEIEVVPANPRQKLTQSITAFLNSCGFYETINVTFIDDATAGLFSPDLAARHLAVKDESRKSVNLLRQNLIGSLFAVLKTNLNAKNTPCRIFEIADTFMLADKVGVLPVEKTRVGLVCDSDLRDLRGVIEGLVGSLNKEAKVTFVSAELPWAQVGTDILVNNEVIGTAGIAGKTVKDRFDFKESPVAAELDFQQLMSLKAAVVKVKAVPRFPAIARDLSLIVDESVCWADITAAVNKNPCDELEDIRFVDIYRGKGIPQGSKSVTLTLTFRDEDGTLTHDTVDGFQNAIVKELTDSVNAQLRTA